MVWASGPMPIRRVSYIFPLLNFWPCFTQNRMTSHQMLTLALLYLSFICRCRARRAGGCCTFLLMLMSSWRRARPYFYFHAIFAASKRDAHGRSSPSPRGPTSLATYDRKQRRYFFSFSPRLEFTMRATNRISRIRPGWGFSACQRRKLRLIRHLKSIVTILQSVHECYRYSRPPREAHQPWRLPYMSEHAALHERRELGMYTATEATSPWYFAIIVIVPIAASCVPARFYRPVTIPGREDYEWHLAKGKAAIARQCKFRPIFVEYTFSSCHFLVATRYACRRDRCVDNKKWLFEAHLRESGISLVEIMPSTYYISIAHGAPSYFRIADFTPITRTASIAAFTPPLSLVLAFCHFQLLHDFRRVLGNNADLRLSSNTPD